MDYQNYYLTTYLFSAIIALFFAINYNVNDNVNWKINAWFTFFLVLIYTIIFGTRDYFIGSDTMMYKDAFRYSTIQEAKDIGFALLTRFFSFFTNERGYFVLIALSYTSILASVFYYFDRTKMYLLFFVFTSMFFFETFGINIIRHGLASMLLMLAIVFFLLNKKIQGIISIIIAVSFHASVATPFLFWLAAKKIKSLKIFFIIFFLSIVLSYLGYGINSLTDAVPVLNIFFKDRFDSYFDKPDWVEYKIGFKASFVLFNLIFAFLGYKLYLNIKDNEAKGKYERFLKTYLITSSFFFMSFYVAFSDRVGALSWVFIPFLLEPLLNKSHYKFGAIFTVLMCFFIFLFFYNTIRTV